MLPAFHLSCSEMICKWEEMLCKDSTTELDIMPFLEFLSGEAISRTAFGGNYENGRRIFQLQREQARYVTNAMRSFYIPGWRYAPTKMHRRMNEINKELKALIKQMIREREKAMQMTSGNEFDDLLSTLLNSNRKVVQENGPKQKHVMTTEDIVEECKLFFSAGQETTSSLLVWTIIMLSVNPDWQARAREEVIEVFGTNQPDFDGLGRLKVVTMILFEVLRLYPPATAVLRTIEKDTQLGEMLLPARTTIFLPTLLVHHDVELWGEDASDFNPQRFSEGISKATKGRISFFPFGWGHRSCIGQNFAMIEAKLVLSMILQRFKFKLSPGYSHRPLISVVLQPEHGAQIILSKY
ncbi:Cytochrome P450, E-class, group I [Parasponia andersonii]|uniref:Cytochrome P450, E-class, group I n=1 Tax=Parasponia andersonii TaxID=3476 RepID=A0A2P5DSH5_PARAD|nr:Cytochrome P450, E-class, group I [Parasponia andersonii]